MWSRKDVVYFVFVCNSLGGYFTAGIDSKLLKNSILYFCSEVSITIINILLTTYWHTLWLLYSLKMKQLHCVMS